MFFKSQSSCSEEDYKLRYSIWMEDRLVLDRVLAKEVYEYELKNVRDNDVVELHFGNTGRFITWTGKRLKEDAVWLLAALEGKAGERNKYGR